MAAQARSATTEAAVESDKIFADAKAAFLAELSPGEATDFAECQSTSELIQAVRGLKVISKLRNRGSRILGQIKRFSDSLSPYFKIMELLAATHPEWANIALGALFLVFKMASNFVTFFEKLGNVIEKISTRLPLYTEMLELLRKNNDTLNNSLRHSFYQFYKDLFEFFACVARVFTKKTGKIKRTPVVVADLMWKPFDVRFQNFLEKIDFHQEVIRETLAFSMQRSHTKETLEHSESTFRWQQKHDMIVEKLEERYNKDSKSKTYTPTGITLHVFDKIFFLGAFLSSVRKWLNPPDYKIEFEQALDLRSQGTSQWFLENPILQNWLIRPVQGVDISACNSPASYPASILWVSGNAGSGKTVLSASSIDSLAELIPDDGGSPVKIFYYFFSQRRGRNNSPVDAYRALVMQLLQHFHTLVNIFDIFALLLSDPDTNIRASEHELIEILRLCLPQLPNLLFIIDGIDECPENEKFIEELAQLCVDSTLRVLLLSRPDVLCLRRRVPQGSTISLTKSDIQEDISRYVKPEIAHMKNSGLLPPTIDLEKIAERLSHRADGMSLWARLMIGYLRSPAMTMKERMKSITESTPDGLDDMYNRIRDRINSLDPRSNRLAQNVTILDREQRACSAELQDALYAHPNKWDIDSPEDFPEFPRFNDAVIVSCCGLVEHIGESFHYIHLTTLDYVQSQDPLRKPYQLIPSRTDSMALMANRCISYLTSTIPLRPLASYPSDPTSVDYLPRAFLLLRYCSIEWPWLSVKALEHGESSVSDLSIPQKDFLSAVRMFLKSPINVMIWIEALYTFSADFSFPTLDFCPTSVQKLKKSVSDPQEVDVIEDLQDLRRDVLKIHDTWKQTLSKEPEAIWRDVTIFTQSRFLVHTRAGWLEKLANGTAESALETHQAIFSRSLSASDGGRLAVLKVFPSEKFVISWKGALPIDISDSDIHNGWIATYHITEIKEKSSTIQRASIPLGSLEVSIALQQSLRRSEILVMPFPPIDQPLSHVLLCSPQCLLPPSSSYYS
ncbi:hypothetical protein F4803DRAFT_550773 [Xylaria telfairii]|nr:hypothetical protein F4803DRAFT_550773 [Xylaria telfairii]